MRGPMKKTERIELIQGWHQHPARIVEGGSQMLDFKALLPEIAELAGVMTDRCVKRWENNCTPDASFFW